MAIDVAAFGPREEYEERVEALVRQVRSARRQDGRTYLPGEIEHEQAERREREGIAVSGPLRAQLSELAARLGVPGALLQAA
jgi:LDH2 family malate/lactate/ureidoglycolate dehydrogenase